MSDTDFYSQATSFVSAAQGGVDPRTGLFGLSLPLGSLTGNCQLGPVLPLTLSYSPMNAVDCGFGVGFSLNVSTFNTATGRLSLATGEQFQVQTSGSGALTVLQKALDIFHLEKQGSNSYRIIHKTGDIEVLAGLDEGGPLKRPKRILSPAGHGLTLTNETGGLNRLVSIDDDSERLLNVVYSTNTITFTFLPGKTESWQIALTLDGVGKLVSLTRRDTAGKEAPLTWTLTYSDMHSRDKIWGPWLTGIAAPGGATTEATYRTDGNTHRYPQSAPQTLQNNPMPYVTQVKQHPGGAQPGMTLSYAYSDQNFLGYNSGVSWDALQDNLYHCMTDYAYSSTETHTDENNTATVVERTYNNYHLMTRQVTTTGGTHELKVETTYYAVVGKAFDQQVPYFQFPKSVTTTWTDKDNNTTRQEVSTSEFDTSGNPTRSVAPDGTVTVLDYYPAAGVNGQCPTEPNGFTRFGRSKTVTPPDCIYGQVTYSVPPQTSIYEYTSVPPYTLSPAGQEVRGLVVQSRIRHYSDNTLLAEKTMAYDMSGGKEAGRLTARTDIHYPDGTSGKAHTTSTAIIWTDKPQGQAERVEVTRTVTSCDTVPITVTHSVQQSRYTGRVWQSTDIKGRVSTASYDNLGRQLTRTVMQDTRYEATEYFEYSLNDNADVPYAVTHTDVLGNQTRAWLDGLGRHVQTDMVDVLDDGKTTPQSTWSTLHQSAYDQLGRAKSATALDYHGQQKYTLTQTQTWDNWGKESVNRLSDGKEVHTQYDPTTLTSQGWHQGTKEGSTLVSGSAVTWYDNSHRPFKTALYTVGSATPYSTTWQQYDGLGRLRSETDAMNRTTTYEYDNWGRAVRTTLPDGTAILRTYDPSTPSAQAITIAVRAAGDSDDKAKILGSRTFDGTGRLLTETTGGRTTRYDYDSDADGQPCSVTLPDGTIQTFTYITELGDALGSVAAGNITQSFSYNPQTGAPVMSREKIVGMRDNILSTDYWPSGHQKSITASYEMLPERTVSNTRTTAGATVTVTDYAGVTQTLARDTYGRIIGSTDTDGITTTISYDALGRQVSHTTVVGTTGYSQTTTLTLDDFGRETMRVQSDSKGMTTQISQGWNENHQVTNRVTTQHGVTLRNEKYSYDERNRLKTYTCSTDMDKNALPQDSLGSLLGQQYTYDLLGNILTCVTTYDGSPGSNTVTYIYSNPDDPCQLTGYVPNTNGAEMTLSRDACGRVTLDDAGRTLGYDALGRLSTLKLPNDSTAGSYGYDAQNRLVSQRPANDPITTAQTRYYLGNKLNVVKKGTNPTLTNEVRLSGDVQHHMGDGKDGIWLSVSDSMGSVLSVDTGSQREEYRYSPFGESNLTASPSVISNLGDAS